MEGWTHESRMDALIAERDQLKVELAVSNGTACAEEQADGNGPCGICRTCYARRVEKAMGLIEAISKLKGHRSNVESDAIKLSDEAFAFIMAGPNDEKGRLERAVVKAAKMWIMERPSKWDGDRALEGAITELVKEEQRRESR